MKMRLVRYIHPVGQGAFYTEQFYNDYNQIIATVVYDCGSETSKPGIEREIKGMFRKGDKIDILFVSHFHEDHINGIAKLKELTDIKNVVIPLYDDKLQYLLLATIRPRNKDDNLEDLITTPHYCPIKNRKSSLK